MYLNLSNFIIPIDQIVATRTDFVERDEQNRYTVSILVWVKDTLEPFTQRYVLLPADYEIIKHKAWFNSKKLIKYSLDDAKAHPNVSKIALKHYEDAVEQIKTLLGGDSDKNNK